MRKISSLFMFRGWCYNDYPYLEKGVYSMDNNWISLLQNQNQLSKVIETNQYTEQFGLTLSQQEAQLILDNKKVNLRCSVVLSLERALRRRLFMSSVIRN